MSQYARARRGTGRNRDSLLRKMYGLDIWYGNAPRTGLCYDRSGMTSAEHQAQMRASAERARRYLKEVTG